MTAADPLCRFNSDPDALAWARKAIQHEIDRLRRWQQECTDKGDVDRALQWRKMANLLERNFIGGTGCVIAAFDERKPQYEQMLANSTSVRRN